MGKALKITSLSDLNSLPLILLIFSILTFAVSPLTNMQSRHHELQSDTYAMDLTGDKQAAIKTFQDLTKSGLSQVNPPYLVKIFRYGHPTILERISFVEKYERNE